MSENGEDGERKTTVISLHDERPPMPKDEAVEQMKRVLKSLAGSRQRLGLDENAASRLREEIHRKRGE